MITERNRKLLAGSFITLIIALVCASVTEGSAAVTDVTDVDSALQWAQDQKTACQAALNRGGLSNADRSFFQACVRHADQEITALTTTPSPTSSTTPPATPPATSTAPATSPPTTTPPPSPSPTPNPTGTTVHGRDISQANTGYLNWVGPQGQRCTDATLRVYTGRVNASSVGNATCVWLQRGLNVDAAITLTASRVSAQIDATGPRLTLNWSVVDATDFEWAIGGHVTAFRSQLYGASDGIRAYGTTCNESWVRVRRISSEDHNDGVQAYRATEGSTLLRCNIDTRPVNGTNPGNAAVFMADDSTGVTEIRDNWLAGGGYTLRLHENQFYRVTGNIIDSWEFGPKSTDNARVGAFLEWTNNRTSSGALVNP